GGYAEEAAIAADRLVPLPDAMDFATGAGFMLTYCTSLYALENRGQLQTGETLLVLGAAGGVGLAAVDLGKAMGARVIAAASSADKLEKCRAMGAAEIINYETEDLKERVRELTQGAGADVIYD
ncbi:MAG TPA: NADPH:quinone oxidoreductase, partial [Alphaproteobacteria bacterium]|nr:NADPH:quinone oxidoreductase [Alphaproteobacteria bacterium]